MNNVVNPPNSVPLAYRSVFSRAAEGKSRAAGVKAFCLACVGFLKADVKNCSAKACPLHPYRPYQHGDEENEQGGINE